MKNYIKYLVLITCLLFICSCSKGKKETTIELIGNASTGFFWNYSISDENIIKLVKEDSKYSGDQGQVGAPSTYYWTFKGLKKGNAMITFKYSRDFESDVLYKITYHFEVDKKGNIKSSNVESSELDTNNIKKPY